MPEGELRVVKGSLSQVDVDNLQIHLRSDGYVTYVRQKDGSWLRFSK